jgi:cytochrome d ubiquinol oxidase subunit II
MPLEDLAAAVVLLGIIAYAMFGGADFGGGIWTGLASGPRAAQQREAISRAMGPVWETNHVWLILIVVATLTAFPPAFADLSTALIVPVVIALVGIVFRGAAFAFRHFGHGTETALPGMTALFSVASVVAPLVMGMALGAVAGGHVTIEDGVVTSGVWEPWLQPFSILCGLIAVAMCSFLAACYMTVRTSGEMQEDFRTRGLLAGLLLGALTIIALPVAYWDAEPFWDELAKPSALAVMSAAAAIWMTSLVVLWRRWYVLAPPLAAGTVGLVMGGWAAVQYPYFILPDERISDLAAADATLGPFLIALVAGAVILVPSLALLYLVFSEETGGPAVGGEGEDRVAS